MTSCACCYKQCLGWHILTSDRTLLSKCICGFDFIKQSITAFKGLTDSSLSKAFTRNVAVQNDNDNDNDNDNNVNNDVDDGDDDHDDDSHDFIII